MCAWWKKVWKWSLHILNKTCSCRLFPHFTSNSFWAPYAVIFCTWRLLFVFSFTGQLKMKISQNGNQIWWRYLGFSFRVMNFHDVFRVFLGSGFKLFVHKLRHRKRGRMSGCSYQLHLADCGQKNACSALTLRSIPETITVFLNLVTHTELKLSFFSLIQILSPAQFTEQKYVWVSSGSGLIFKIIYQQSNLPAASRVKEGRSAELISVLVKTL